MVLSRKPNLCEHRPCVLCGDNAKMIRKTVPVDTILEHLDLALAPLQQTQVWRTLENVCLSAIAVQQQQQKAAFSETVALCFSCSHWTTNKKKVHVAPLVQFKWHLRTLVPLGRKRFDKRSIHRIATVLSQPDNFYRSLFTPPELKCIAKMTKMKAKDVNHAASKLFWKENTKPLFVEDSNVAELLRF